MLNGNGNPMIRLKRRNTAWLTTLGLLIAFALIAGGLEIGVQLLLLGIFAIAMIASVVELGRERETLIDAIKRAPLRQRISPQAKESVERARARGGFVNNNLMLLDVGLIASQSSYEGMAMRRTRNISKDDDGARPFVTLYVDSQEADRNVLVRFEIVDQNGEQQYIHEMKSYLRDGEMSIMADHHLPLAGNRDIQGYGDWDLRVYIDGNLASMHNFLLGPSVNERSRRLASEYDDTRNSDYFQIIDEVAQETPLSLQELLHKDKSANAGAAPSRSRGTESSSRGTESSSRSNESRRVTTSTRSRRKS